MRKLLRAVLVIPAAAIAGVRYWRAMRAWRRVDREGYRAELDALRRIHRGQP